MLYPEEDSNQFCLQDILAYDYTIYHYHHAKFGYKRLNGSDNTVQADINWFL